MDTIGGAQIHVRDIANHLHNEGYDVHLITGKRGNIHNLGDMPIHIAHHLVRDVNPLLDIRAFFELRRLLKSIGPDLVATHSSKAGMIGRLVAASLRIPVIFTAHGWSFTDGVRYPKKLVYGCMEKIAGYFTSGIIAVSEYDKRLAMKHKIIHEEKIVCIQNGVHDIRRYRKIHKGKKETRLIMIARFAHPKMQFQLLESLVKLKHLDWKMHFVGDGPEKYRTRQFAIENDIIHKVYFEGWRDDVDDMLEDSDIFILLSKYEGLPLSILEAMRAGLPIIATDVGGVREAVTKENGIILRAGDSSSLIKALENLIENRELQREMGMHGRYIYEQKFTFQKMFKATIAYYWKIAGVDCRK